MTNPTHEYIRHLLDQLDLAHEEAQQWARWNQRLQDENNDLRQTSVSRARVAELERHVEHFLATVPAIGPGAGDLLVDLRNAIKALENNLGDWQAKKAEEA